MADQSPVPPPAQPRQIGRPPPPSPPPSSSRRTPIIIGAVFILIMAGAWWLGRSSVGASSQQTDAKTTQADAGPSAAKSKPTAAARKLDPSTAARDLRKVLASTLYALVPEEEEWKEAKEAISDFDASRKKDGKAYSARWFEEKYQGVWVVSKMSTDEGATYKSLNKSKLCLTQRDRITIPDGSKLYVSSIHHLNTPDHQIFVTFPDRQKMWFVTDTDKPGVFLLQEMTLSGKAPVQFHEGSRVVFTVE